MPNIKTKYFFMLNLSLFNDFSQNCLDSEYISSTFGFYDVTINLCASRFDERRTTHRAGATFYCYCLGVFPNFSVTSYRPQTGSRQNFPLCRVSILKKLANLWLCRLTIFFNSKFFEKYLFFRKFRTFFSRYM